MPHLSIDLRAEFRAGVVDRWLADHASGLTPNPCVRCNGSVRLDAMLELAERLGSETLATGHYARVIEDGASADSSAPLLRAAADERKDQSYVLSALAPELARAPALPARRAAQARRCASSPSAPGWRSPRKPRLAGPVLPRRHPPRRLPRAPRRSRPAPRPDRRPRRSACSASTPARTPTPSASATASASPAPEPLYVLATDARYEHRHRRAARRRCLRASCRVRERRRSIATGDVRRRRARARTRAHASRAACRRRSRPGARARRRRARHEPAERTAPGQIACLYAGDLVVGHGTIACRAAPSAQGTTPKIRRTIA